MARDERVITVLVASPSDLEPERGRLEEVIREFNNTWSKVLRTRIELVKWETHGYPDIGEDAQEVLNRQLGGDYDIFFGMMWSKFGTPTGRAGSGTEEEFNRALERYKRDAASVKIMFYFKDAPLPPSKMNPEDLSKIQKFKSSLGEEGTLYWPFSSLDDFANLARVHLARHAQEFVKAIQQPPSSELKTTEAVVEMSAAADISFDADITHDELGWLDLIEIVDERFSALSEITERITSETNSLGDRMNKRNEEINAATALIRTGGKFSPKDAKALISKAASDMNQYAARVRPELPLFRDGLQEGIDAMVKASVLSVEIGDADRKQLYEVRTKMAELGEVLHTSSGSTRMFRDAIQGLPRMTSRLNQAKRELAILLDEITETLATGRRLLIEAIKGLDEL